MFLSICAFFFSFVDFSSFFKLFCIKKEGLRSSLLFYFIFSSCFFSSHGLLAIPTCSRLYYLYCTMVSIYSIQNMFCCFFFFMYQIMFFYISLRFKFGFFPSPPFYYQRNSFCIIFFFNFVSMLISCRSGFYNGREGFDINPWDLMDLSIANR